MTRGGILNVKRGICMLRHRQPPGNMKRRTLHVFRVWRWSGNMFLCLLSPLHLPEWTHLLLSGPHVPLVPADPKAPVQCSPCKKQSNTALMSPHCPPHGRRSHSVCIGRIWLAEPGGRGTMKQSQKNVTFRYFLMISSSYFVKPSQLAPGERRASRVSLQILCDPRLTPKLLFIPKADPYRTKQMMDSSLLKPTLFVLSLH